MIQRVDRMVEVPISKDKWAGRVGTVELGADAASGGTRDQMEVGGQGCMPFLEFEGCALNRPLIAGEVLDDASELPHAVKAQFGDAVKDPALWAKAWIDKGADLICLRLVSTNPEERDTTPEEAATTVKKVLEATKAPLIVYGCGQEEKDAKVLEAVSNIAARERLLLGQAEEGAYKSTAAAAMANGHAIIAFSNLDINLAKQIVILLTDYGVKKDNIIIDPLMAPLGMGLEYSYSVNERIRLAALAGDAMLQVPMLCDCTEAWKCREATDENPTWGDATVRGTWWEATTAIAALLSGADILILRSPAAMDVVREALDSLRGGN